MRAQKYRALADEHAAGFADLEAALTEELARAAPHRPRRSVLRARPVGALQCVLARRVAVPSRLARVDPIETSCSRSAGAPTAGSGSR